MNSEQNRSAEELVQRLREVPTEKHSALLEQWCPDDEEVRDEVRILLQFEKNKPGKTLVSCILRGLDRVTESAPGQRIGPFRLHESLGSGGMGEVWLAEQEEPVRRLVALKILKRGMDTKQVLARFEAERQALALMDHANIAKFHDAGETPDGHPYFVMEHIKGEPITRYCDRHRLTTAERLALFAQVCDGVQHAHQKAVIHRDLKPSNILVCVPDKEPVPKIIDFGLAKAIGHRLTNQSLYTKIGSCLGTPEYMSPEQAGAGGTDVDIRTDVYSLGVLLYELLTGVHPCGSLDGLEASDQEVLRRIREVEPSKPSTRLSAPEHDLDDTARRRRTEPRALRRLLRGELDWITMRALEKDRTRRYGSAAALGDEVRRYVNREPVVAGPPSSLYRVSRFLHRHRTGVVVALVAVLALLGFAGAMMVQAHRVGAERDRADLERDAAQQVVAFLSDMFRDVEPDALGASLERNLRDRVEQAQRARGATEEETEAALATLADLFRGVNPTDAALQLLDEQILDRAGQTIEDELQGQPLIAARLRNTIGATYLNLGLFDRAEPFLREALEARRRALGDEHPDTLTSASVTGDLLRAQSKLAEAERLYLEALEVRRRVLGDGHEDTLKSIGDMGDLLRAQGKWAEAEPFYREALERSRRVLGADHPDALGAAGKVGDVLRLQGKLAEAEPFYREALVGNRRVLGDDDPDTLRSISSMGILLWARGKPVEAEPLMREALEGFRRVLGDEHPDTLTSTSLMGDLFRSRGMLAEAEPFYRRALEGRRRVLGDDHPRTLISMGNMGILLKRQGKLEEAEPFHREALEGFRRVLGDDHPNTLASMAFMGDLLLGQRKFEAVEPFYREVLEGRRRVLGDDHPDTLISINNMGVLLKQRGRPDAAEPLLREALEGYRRVLGNDHPNTLSAIHQLGLVLWAQGKPEAEPYLREALDRQRRVLGDDHPQTLDSIYDVASVAVTTGRTAQSLDLLGEAIGLGWASRDILTNPDFDGLRGTAEFEAIVAEVRERLGDS